VKRVVLNVLRLALQHLMRLQTSVSLRAA